MNKLNKVSIILVAIVAIATFITIFAIIKGGKVSVYSGNEHTERIEALNDSIAELKKEITHYKEELSRIEIERELLKDSLDLILKDNEKIDVILANGDWDTNIHFLTDFLSKKDSVGK